MLDRAEVNSGPQVPRHKSGSQHLQTEVVRIELRAFCDRLAVVQKVELGIAPAGREEQGSLHWILLSTSSPAGRDGDRTFLVSLRCPVAIRLVGDARSR